MFDISRCPPPMKYVIDEPKANLTIHSSVPTDLLFGTFHYVNSS